MQDIGFVHYWWRHDYRAAADWFERASQVPGAPWLLRVAGRHDARRRRRPAVVAHDVGGASAQSAEIDWLRRDAERRLMQLDALDVIDVAAARGRCEPTAAAGAAACRLGESGARRRRSRHAARSDRRAATRSTPSGACAVAARRRSFRCPTSRKRDSPAGVMSDRCPVLVAAGSSARSSAASSTSASTGCRSAGRSCGPARRAARAGASLAWFENIPVVSYLVLGGRCRSCRAPISMRYPIVEALTARACSRPRWWYYGPGAAARLAAAVRLRADRALRDRPRAPPAAERHHAARASSSASRSASSPSRAGSTSLIGIVVGGGVLWAIAEGYYRLRHEEGLGHGRREDAGDDRRVRRLEADAGHADDGVVRRIDRRRGADRRLERGGLKYALPFGTFLAMGAALAATVGPASSTGTSFWW